MFFHIRKLVFLSSNATVRLLVNRQLSSVEISHVQCESFQQIPIKLLAVLSRPKLSNWLPWWCGIASGLWLWLNRSHCMHRLGSVKMERVSRTYSSSPGGVRVAEQSFHDDTSYQRILRVSTSAENAFCRQNILPASQLYISALRNSRHVQLLSPGTYPQISPCKLHKLARS